MTPDDFRRMADQLDAEAAELAKAGDVPTGVVRSIEAERLRQAAADQERLTKRAIGRTVRTTMDVDTTGQSRSVKFAAARSRRKHPAQAAALSVGLTIQALADALGEKRSRVSHWMAEPDAGRNFPRPVPAAIADKLARGMRIKRPDGETVTLVIPRSAWGRIAE